MVTAWDCTGTLIGTILNEHCAVTASTTAGLYNGANFQEWLFVAGVFLFFISLMAWGRFYKPIKEIYES